MNGGCFHKSYIHTGTFGMSYLLRIDLLQRVPDFSYLPHLQQKMLEQIHGGHQGIEKCMLKAKESVFWPGISNDIREAVESVESARVFPR